MLFLNRAQESFTTTGIGTLTLGGAPAGWRTIAASLLADFALSDTVTKVAYYCVNSDETIWEFGYGTVDTVAGTITRNLIDSSTGALISWSAGTKYLFSTPEAIQFTNHLTHFRGNTAPAHARAGYTWTDTTAGVTDVRSKYFDGADWLSLFSIDETNNRVYPLDHAGARIHGPEVDVASAATCDIGAVTSDNVRVTGSTGPITSLGTGAAGLRRTVRFASTPTLTHHATQLILPGSASIAAAAGDRAVFKSLGSGNWECVFFQRADGLALVAALQAIEPGGRLTLTSATPVMTSGSVTAAATIYYALYKHNIVPLWTGAAWSFNQITELSLALDSNSGHTGYHQSGKNFDLFIYNDAGTIRLCSGPAWTNDTTRADALARKDGRWTNNASIVLRFDASASTVTAAANTALYVGTFRASANGQTEWTPHPSSVAGGSNNKLLLWNACNRVRVSARVQDSNVSHTYTSATFRSMANSDNTRISFVIGLREHGLQSHFQVTSSNSSGAIPRNPAIGYDTNTGPSGLKITVSGEAGGTFTAISTFDMMVCEIGFHFLQEIERGAAVGTTTWIDAESALFLFMEM